jgi:hypothetical protein
MQRSPSFRTLLIGSLGLVILLTTSTIFHDSAGYFVGEDPNGFIEEKGALGDE